MSDGGKASWVARAATGLTVVACYGTTLLLGLLSLLGISMAVDEGAWAGAVSVFAVLAALAIAASYRRHRSIWPIVVAASGSALILWAMHGSYSRVTELAGFGLLIAATLWDWRLGTRSSAAVDAVSWIESDALRARLACDPKPAVIDVRAPDEYIGPLGHIADARNLPIGELPNRLHELETLKDNAVVLVCRTDKRSAAGAALLCAAGFHDVRVLRGGMERWNENGLPNRGDEMHGRCESSGQG